MTNIIGEFKKARELNYKGTQTYIWQACAVCGKERWVIFKKGMAVSNMCDACSRVDSVRREKVRIAFTGENNHQWKGGKINRICKCCGNSFKAAPSHTKRKGDGTYCSKKCTYKSIYKKGEENHNWKGGKVSINCTICGKEFKRYAYTLVSGAKYCCSYECKAIHQIQRGDFIFQPNKKERILINLFSENNIQFKYTGDGKFWVRNRNPDFVSCNGTKQIIEFMGTYYHPLFDGADRINHYKKYGFDCLVIWEDELTNMDKVLKKVKTFSSSQSNIVINKVEDLSNVEII